MVLDIITGVTYLIWVVAASYGMSVPNGTHFLSIFDNVTLPGVIYRLDCYSGEVVDSKRLIMFAWFLSILMPTFLFAFFRSHRELYTSSVYRYERSNGLKIFGKYWKPGWWSLLVLIGVMLIPIIKAFFPTDIFGHCSNHFRGVSMYREIFFEGIWIISVGLFAGLAIVFMNGRKISDRS